jgi:hypothetical protein
MPRARKIRGRFCEKPMTSKRAFDRRSFRYKKSGRSWILVGCPKGKWNMKTQRCRVGTKAHKILAASKPGAPCCPKARAGERCVLK